MAAILVAGVLLGGINYAFNPRVADAVASLREIRQAEGYRVQVADLAALEPLLWVDARSAQEYEREHVAGAVHLPPESFDDQLADLFERWEPGQTIVVYCGGAACNASNEVAERLRQAFGESVAGSVLVLKGGWEALPQGWKGQGSE